MPALLEAGGHSGRLYEADLGRPIVRCWLEALVARADPLPVQPRGEVTVRKGPFSGEPWDRLSRDALQEPGRP